MTNGQNYLCFSMNILKVHKLAIERLVKMFLLLDRKELLVLAYWVKNVEVNRNSSS